MCSERTGFSMSSTILAIGIKVRQRPLFWFFETVLYHKMYHKNLTPLHFPFDKLRYKHNLLIYRKIYSLNI